MVSSSKKVDRNSIFRHKMTKNHCIFCVVLGIKRYFAVLELVSRVGQSITFCVLRSAFQHNIPTLPQQCCYVFNGRIRPYIKLYFHCLFPTRRRRRLPETRKRLRLWTLRHHGGDYFVRTLPFTAMWAIT